MTADSMTKALVSRSFVPGAHAIVLTVVPGDYGSLEIERLDQLQEDLLDAARCDSLDSDLSSESRTVIVDLANVRVGGSGMLGVLARLRSELVAYGRELVLCGDKTGLVATVGWSECMSLCPDLYTAIETVARRNQCETRRPLSLATNS